MPPPHSVIAAARFSANENGSNYELGEWYEGVVKRYNPMRGFGFLTATHHLRVISPPTQQSLQPTASMNGTTINKGTGVNTTIGATADAKGITMITSEVEKAVDTKKNDVSADVQARVERTVVSLGDIFVHQSYIQMQGFRALSIGDRVVFRIGVLHGRKAHQAVSVQRIGEHDKSSMATETATPVAGNNAVGKTHTDDKGENMEENEKGKEERELGTKIEEKENKENDDEDDCGEITSGRFSAHNGSNIEQDVESLAVVDNNRRNLPTHSSLQSPNIIDSCQMIGDCQSGFNLPSLTFENENMFFQSTRTVDVQDASQHVNEQNVLPDVNELCDLLETFGGSVVRSSE